MRQKAPSAKRRIRTDGLPAPASSAVAFRQKASSAKSWIKTSSIDTIASKSSTVRKHRAPKGALRLHHSLPCCRVLFHVRKHRAPKGALRRDDEAGTITQVERLTSQKAPSAKRCIKTRLQGALSAQARHVIKHRAPKGALRQQVTRLVQREFCRQKAPSAKRCIKTR